MDSFVFFGKGGIGKSTIASNVSVILAAKRKKVLHIGCDPKMDSVIPLMGRPILPFTAEGVFGGEPALRKSVHASPVTGVFCIEAGGPHPGVGCAGTGIGAMLDAMRSSSLLEKDGYGAAVFDVLGDVVCGGFAAPLRSGFARKAVIIVSEELLSLHAANRLIMMLNSYAKNGVFLAGLAANVKDQKALRTVQDFAQAVGAPLLGTIFRSEAIVRAEKAQRPVVLLEPDSPASRQLVKLCRAIEAAQPPAAAPVPLAERDFLRSMGEGFSAPAADVRPAPGQPGPGPRQDVPGLFAQLGLSFIGMASSQLLCGFRSGGRSAQVIIMHADNYREGMLCVSDWVLCLAPQQDESAHALWPAIAAAAGRLSSLCFDGLVSALCERVDLPRSMDGFDALQAASQRGLLSGQAHMAFGQWYRFIFPHEINHQIAPGSVMLEHGNSECRFNSCGRTRLGMFGPLVGLGAEAEQPIRIPREEPEAICTDFDSEDAFRGDDAKLQKAMDLAVSRAGRGGLVELYMCCSPMIIAEDVGALKARASRAAGVEVLVSNYNDYYQASPEKAAARGRLIAARLASCRGRRPSRDVQLVGFGRWAGELAALLAESGVSVIPPSSDFYSDAAGARLRVLAAHDAGFEQGFAAAALPWVVPTAPYGLGGTRAWLGDILSALGRSPRKILGPGPALLREMRTLAEAARRFKAGFIVASPGEIGLLSGSSATSGVPVIPLAVEAGFSVKLLAYCLGRPERAKVRAQSARLRAGLKSGRLETVFFDTPASLSRALASDQAMRLVYSDVARDRRVLSAGKSVFCASLCEPGYAGAVETARRLLELACCDFNERYLLQD